MPKVSDKAQQTLREEESEAWSEYLEATRYRDSDLGYEEVEGWAWTRLCTRLAEVEVWRGHLSE